MSISSSPTNSSDLLVLLNAAELMLSEVYNSQIYFLCGKKANL